MYYVEWFCELRAAEGIQRSQRPYDDLSEAKSWANAMLPTKGFARVVSKYGNLMYEKRR